MDWELGLDDCPVSVAVLEVGSRHELTAVFPALLAEDYNPVTFDQTCLSSNNQVSLVVGDREESKDVQVFRTQSIFRFLKSLTHTLKVVQIRIGHLYKLFIPMELFASAVSACKSLRFVSLIILRGFPTNLTMLDLLCKELAKCRPTFERWDVYGYFPEALNLRSLNHFLSNSERLKMLRFGGTQTSYNYQGLSLSKALKTNNSVEVFDYFGNNAKVTPILLKAFSLRTFFNKSLVSLQLRCNFIKNQDFFLLFQLLSKNELQVRKLTLSEIMALRGDLLSVSLPVLYMFGVALENSETLEMLKIGAMNLQGKSSSMRFAAGLARNTSLKELQTASLTMDQAGIKRALNENKKIKHVSVLDYLFW